MDDKIKKVCEENIDQFINKVMPSPWMPRSILLSESFLLCAIGNTLKIDLLIESGIYNGRSTSIWCKFFGPEVNIKTIDLVIRKEANEHLKPFIEDKKLEIYEGDSTFIIPKIIKETDKKSIGMFLDGPKSVRAIELAKECLNYNKNIKFFAFHDCYRCSKSRRNLDSWNVTKYYSDDEEFIEKYKFLDEDESQFDHEQNMQWVPYKILPDKDLGGSFGPTMCIVPNVNL